LKSGVNPQTKLFISLTAFANNLGQQTNKLELNIAERKAKNINLSTYDFNNNKVENNLINLPDGYAKKVYTIKSELIFTDKGGYNGEYA